MKKLLLAVMLIGLTACASQEQKAESMCAARATAIDVLTVANNQGKLSKIQQAKVSEAITLTKDICTGATPPTLTSAQVDLLTNYLAVLNQNVAAVNAAPTH